MSGELQREVLKTFKLLHKTRLNTFKGDNHALNFIRKKINDEYIKYKNVTDENAIKELNKFALEVEHELRTTVIQAVEKEPGRFELNVKEEHLVENVPPPGTPLPKYGKKCSQTPKPKPS